ncbi:MAG: aminotransferase class I/II-fold pyridoxal phosphate-dependent enzyme, partial [Bdellovibrionales bacterium]|nr:aminotransferase class I/II-fold pyridoxal phosphate-dependent enzyme [Bdellovibrionales bacterium]
GFPRVVQTDSQSGFKLTAEVLESNITEKTKGIIFNSPSNPTGNMYSLEELKAIGEVLLKHPNVVILSDDIYNELVFVQDEIAPHLLQATPELAERTIVINGVSKTYSMTGWRLGWAIGPKDVISAMTKFQSQTVSCASPFTQQAAVEALLNSDKQVQEKVQVLKQRRDKAVAQLNDIEGISCLPPDGAFYLWPNISSLCKPKHDPSPIKSSKDFAKMLLEKKRVVVVPGAEFGQEGYLRISYALGEERMTEAIRRISDFVKELNA